MYVKLMMTNVSVKKLKNTHIVCLNFNSRISVGIYLQAKGFAVSVVVRMR